MARLNVTVPDELLALVRDALPELNVSGLLQDAMRARLACDHDALACAACGEVIARADVIGTALDDFYGDAMRDVGELAHRCATAEGAARILKTLGLRHGVRAAATRPLPRPSRSVREAAGRTKYSAARRRSA